MRLAEAGYGELAMAIALGHFSQRFHSASVWNISSIIDIRNIPAHLLALAYTLVDDFRILLRI